MRVFDKIFKTRSIVATAALLLVSLTGCEREASDRQSVGTPLSSDDSSSQFRAVDFSTPDTAYCSPFRDWDPELIAFESEVLALSNALRAQGLDCGSQGSFPPVPPLKLNSALNCAARAHSTYMRDNLILDHVGPEGQSPGDRIALTGYRTRGWGENIAYGYATPQEVVEGWKTSEGHCVNLMRPRYNQMGVGVVLGSVRQIHWTQVMAVGDDLEPQFKQPSGPGTDPTPAPLFGPGAVFLLALGLGRALYGARRLA